MAKSDYSENTSKRGTWIRREHYNLDLIHIVSIVGIFSGMTFFGILLFFSYLDSTKPLVATIMGHII